ncbi:hypothetical protein ABZX77_05885, partial [Streptomyces sp. NPDC004237]
MPKPRRSRAVRPPARAAALPRHGGLAVPWITGWFDGRPYFGVNFPLRRIQTIAHGLCQFCREPLGRRIGLVVRPADIAAGYVDEPGMHPECLDYAVAVCPMLIPREFAISEVLVGRNPGAEARNSHCRPLGSAS